ncbi:hypothetical protein FHS57_005138 [Runella defluvii]|uniref:Uncharacterized protein n=1 Tax=Runella defluvii TaxID=370973 RepID=A0A7W5ZP56_9BACT|nr:hypothetical protein [Runella defluvii]MBB3841117.1 hypothetical protein [Runella defluvii]
MSIYTKAATLFTGAGASNNDAQPKWYVQAFRSKPIMYGLVGVAIVGVIYYFGVKSAKNKLMLDQVDLDKLPSKSDKLENITREELDKLVADCRWFFDNISASPGVYWPKNTLFTKLLTLTDYELGVLNNQYNNLYADTDTNLYNEIKDDYWYTYDEDLQIKLLNRLKAIGAGKTKA